MNFGFAWTSVNKPRGETPAPPPEERAPALPPRRLAHGIRIGPPRPIGWFPIVGGLQNGSDILNGKAAHVFAGRDRKTQRHSHAPRLSHLPPLNTRRPVIAIQLPKARGERCGL